MCNNTSNRTIEYNSCKVLGSVALSQVPCTVLWAIHRPIVLALDSESVKLGKGFSNQVHFWKYDGVDECEEAGEIFLVSTV